MNASEPASISFIYLASQSPRRRQLLDQIGVAHRPLLADDSEDAEALEAAWPGETPARYVRRVTAAKLEAAIGRRSARGLTDAPILCADTTVALGGAILGKPTGAEDAMRMLTLLAGRTHRVLTAVMLAWRGERAIELSSSTVRFAPMSALQVERYVDTGEPMGKAGAYAIQGRAAAHIDRIAGSHSGIMGLPLHETALLLRRAGFGV